MLFYSPQTIFGVTVAAKTFPAIFDLHCEFVQLGNFVLWNLQDFNG